MKIRLVIALMGLTISFAVPAFAQEQKSTVDTQIIKQLAALDQKYDKGSFSSNDFRRPGRDLQGGRSSW